jgi:hypothetical protein
MLLAKNRKKTGARAQEPRQQTHVVTVLAEGTADKPKLRRPFYFEGKERPQGPWILKRPQIEKRRSACAGPARSFTFIIPNGILSLAHHAP